MAMMAGIIRRRNGMIRYQGCDARELDRNQIQHFIDDGYLVVEDLIPAEVVVVVVPEIEHALGDIPRRPELWGGHGGYLLKDSPDTAATAKAVGERYRRVVEDLCGPGRIRAMGSGLGYMPIRFPDPEGGGTAIRVGSNRVVSRLLAAAEPDRPKRRPWRGSI
ncbi:MAG: hypothetical protein PF961_01875 [Planctomycetota bacterium]|nr:hypothetical protein [Planctomycetota bacterium]